MELQKNTKEYKIEHLKYTVCKVMEFRKKKIKMSFRKKKTVVNIENPNNQ